MSNNAQRVLTLVICAGLLVMQASPAWAQFTETGTQATNWIVQLLTPLVPLCCIGIAIGCFVGKVNWAWFVGALIGTALFFGRDQVVSMFRGWVGA
jgi:type IV secretion system protein VirB2